MFHARNQRDGMACVGKARIWRITSMPFRFWKLMYVTNGSMNPHARIFPLIATTMRQLFCCCCCLPIARMIEGLACSLGGAYLLEHELMATSGTSGGSLKGEPSLKGGGAAAGEGRQVFRV